ncbi:ABC transporter ATP-binding protein [Falsochrobactrum ovis]|uniref:Carbohydrate ABC transporter ATP-binding protein (CUT1 family) n=1 Tax=Falsochrobactrum ovis TaxID=1293442 RepID=A0A364JRI0_9HYPH|nr:ABC transporter ATP-binding protein [Falsochrobactrum ovis]RAK24782.1 carbohydrate ABC transporter ATP-binding protein (CUT1 family) [Falsochrobactrum ovis]
MSALSIQNISKHYGSNHILNGISIDVEEGEFIALVGPSGCGKSTLLRILAGLDHADSGQIQLGERDITGAHPADRNMAMVFQSYALYPHLTTSQNIAVPLAMRELSAAERLPLIGSLIPARKAKLAHIKARVETTAQNLKIDHLLDRKPGQMSGGQRQRVALARALVRKPGVFLMDEPLSNLDANLRVHTRAEIVDLHRQAGVPTIYVTHDQAEALSMADRVAVMMDGKLLQIDAPETLYNDPRHIDVAKFIGTPHINILDCLTSDHGIVHFAGRPILFNVPAHAATTLKIGIRPEHFKVTHDVENGVAGIISRIEFLGSEVLVYVKAKGSSSELAVKLTPEETAEFNPGIPVGLKFEADKAHIFGEDGLRLRLPMDTKISTTKDQKVAAYV